MKNIVLTSALIIATSVPAFAASTLEATLNVEAGKYTTAQLVEMNFAQSETGSDARVYFGSNKGVSIRAAEIFAKIAAEDTGTQPLPVLASSVGNLSSKGAQSAVAAAIFADMLAAEAGSDR